MKTRFLLLLSIIVLCISCQKENEVLLGSIEGTVSDMATGELLNAVDIEIEQVGGQSSILSDHTSNDGRFAFLKLEIGTYTLRFSKVGYKPLTKENIVIKKSSKDIQVYVQLEKLPSSFLIVDDKGNEITELNFGYEQDDIVRTFNIKNLSDNKLNWSIDQNYPKWIKTIAPGKGSISSHDTQGVTVILDRSKLNEGDNNSTIHVKSEDNVIKPIKVIALNYKAPKLLLYDAENVSYDSVKLVGKVLENGFPEYHAFGFVISENPQPTISNADKKTEFSKQDVENKSNIPQTFTGLLPKKAYYARVYTISVIDTTYSNIVSFVTLEAHYPKLTIEEGEHNGLQVSFYSKITDYGGSPIIEKGVCWSTEQMPKVDQNNSQRTKDGTGDGAFTSTISNLLPSTTYYFRSYAKNYDGYGYSEEQLTIKSGSGIPKLEILYLTPINDNSVKVKYKITEDAGSTIKEHGVCYANKLYPDTSDTKIKYDGDKGDEYTIHIDGLQGNKLYYFRAYAINSADIIGYSKDTMNTIVVVEPIVETDSVRDITTSSAICVGNVISDGGSSIIERGICWENVNNPEPALDKSNTSKAETNGEGQFSCVLTGLKPNTKYNYRAYALNNSGIPGYGETMSFTTLANVPTVITYDASTANGSIILKGKVTDNGGSEITRCGFICNNGYNYEAPLSSGEFSRTIKTNEFAPGTTYSFYAYAYNANTGGEPGKGATKTFTTPDGKPTVTNQGVTVNSATSATIVGNITDNGGYGITECGVCYSKSVSRPTKENSEYTTITNVKSGQFSSTITGLEPNTKYYYNVYALNGNGITYGIPDYFKTQNVTLTIDITQQPTYEGNNATVYGKITSDGGADIVYYGVVFSRYNSQPTLDNKEGVINQEGNPTTNDISFSFTNIPSGVMVYYRFYVVNSLAMVAYSTSGYITGL